MLLSSCIGGVVVFLFRSQPDSRRWGDGVFVRCGHGFSDTISVDVAPGVVGVFLCALFVGCGESGVGGVKSSAAAEKLLLLDIEEQEEMLAKAEDDMAFFRVELGKNKSRKQEALEEWKGRKMSDAGYKLRMSELDAHTEELMGFLKAASKKRAAIQDAIDALKDELRQLYGGS